MEATAATPATGLRPPAGRRRIGVRAGLSLASLWFALAGSGSVAAPGASWGAAGTADLAYVAATSREARAQEEARLQTSPRDRASSRGTVRKMSPRTQALRKDATGAKARRATTARARKHVPASVGAGAAAAAAVAYADRADAVQLADAIATERQLDAAWVRRVIAEARLLPQVQRLVLPPPAGTPKNWRAYRSRFIEPTRIQAGVRFWQAQQRWLERAEREYGVPPEMVVGIIGVETLYGQHMGSFRVVDALATLALDFPAAHPRAAERSAFFRSEMGHFLALSKAAGDDPREALGSFAGAMGMPQFMPSSRARFAVDFDGDGRIDLHRSTADVIGSVANYFRSFGWKPGMPTHYPVRFDEARLDKEALLLPDILPTFSASAMASLGALVDGPALLHEGPLALVELQNGPDAPQYVAGTENFYVITRYNWSSYYAMAVIELGQAVRDSLGRQPAPPTTGTR